MRGKERTGRECTGQGRTGKDRTGKERKGKDRTGQDCRRTFLSQRQTHKVFVATLRIIRARSTLPDTETKLRRAEPKGLSHRCDGDTNTVQRACMQRAGMQPIQPFSIPTPKAPGIRAVPLGNRALARISTHSAEPLKYPTDHAASWSPECLAPIFKCNSRKRSCRKVGSSSLIVERQMMILGFYGRHP